MDDLQSSEELAFIPEQVEPLLYEAIGEVLQKESYSEDKVQGWVDQLCSICLKSLADLQKPYKYVVTCQIMQRTGAGIHTAHSCFWNREDDNIAQVVWPSDKKGTPKDTNNSRLVCIITAVGFSL
ncbi:hypothetical protein TrCOL_g7366 [Triparma columacea]|uniref:Uncharacterized protein n=1 Tax=Triparma columacea TaxID=722753 RepID=A0A9W7GGG5_9STRA|nr:hypothetical protein TrCOL_g7366 [Triparma columacea]